VDAWDVPELHDGLVAGSLGAAVVALVAVSPLRRRPDPLPLAGLVIAAAGTWVAMGSLDVPRAVPIGVALAACAGSTAAARVPLRVVPIVLALASGFALGFHGGLVGDTWIRFLVFGAVAACGLSTAVFDVEWRREAPGPALLLMSAGGVFAAVPDTEAAGALLGAALPLACLGWPLRVARLGAAGAATSAALLVWSAGVGGAGRPASIIGSVACFGMFVGAPDTPLRGRRLGELSRRVARAGSTLRVSALGISHALIVVVAARVASRREELWPAVAVASVTVVAAVTARALLGPKPAPVAARSA
jgi:hypothetical protein